MKKEIFLKEDNKGIKGITLSALVITIIVLLILAGVSIAMLTGENGILAKATKAKEEYAISQAKEKVELAIQELMIEEQSKGNTITKESLKGLEGRENYEISVESTDSFPVEAVCDMYKFRIDENYRVTYIGKANGTIATYTTEPLGYTNQESVTIKLEVKNAKGIKEIQCPDGTSKSQSNATETTIDYPVTKNGTYSFKIINSENEEEVKEIVIDKIDKLAPKDFTITAQVEENKITITGSTEDEDATEENAESGIDRYEYYVTDSSNNTKKYDKNEIDIVSGGTYSVYVIAYDKAGNPKQSNKVNNLKMSQLYNSKHPEYHIPTGFSYKEGTASTGYVITDGTNEFVWIPVASSSDYTKRAGVNNGYMTSSGGSSSNIGDMVRGDKLGVSKIIKISVTSTLSNQPEAQIVNNAGGFWVGRYEAGVANASHNNIAGLNGVTSDSTSASTLNTYWEGRKTEIVVKQDAEPVRNITQTKALEIANGWKSGEASNGKVAFQSGLITGTQWDTMCNFIGWNVCNSDCKSWGNYANIASANYETYHSSDCASDWKKETTTKGTSNNRWIFPTGKFVNSNNGNTAKKNIYDVAGNVWEWTTEVPQYSANNSVLRGGSAFNDGSDNLAAYRGGHSSSSVYTGWSIGLRFVLYVQ